VVSEACGLGSRIKGFEIAMCDLGRKWSRLVLPFPTDGANCTCKKYGKDSRVVNRILGFRLRIRCLENALKSSIYSLLWAWALVAWFPSNRGICVF
jgi:hypothetical protein